MYRLEMETMKLLDFVQAFSDFPFIFDISTKKGIKKKVLPLINYMEHILECLI